MHVRLATDRRRVAKLRSHQTHGQREVSFCFRRAAWRTNFREDSGGAEGATPRAKILRLVAAAETPLQVRADVTRRQRPPAAVVTMAEEPRARRSQLRRDEADQSLVGDHLPLRLAALASIGEADDAVAQLDM